MYRLALVLAVLSLAPRLVHADASEPTHVGSSVCETDARCPGSKLCWEGRCENPHTLDRGHYLTAVGGGILVPAAVLLAIGTLIQIPDEFSFTGRNGTLSTAFLISGGVVALTGLALIVAGAVFRRKGNALLSSASIPVLFPVPGGVAASLTVHF